MRRLLGELETVESRLAELEARSERDRGSGSAPDAGGAEAGPGDVPGPGDASGGGGGT